MEYFNNILTNLTNNVKEHFTEGLSWYRRKRRDVYRKQQQKKLAQKKMNYIAKMKKKNKKIRRRNKKGYTYENQYLGKRKKRVIRKLMHLLDVKKQQYNKTVAELNNIISQKNAIINDKDIKYNALMQDYLNVKKLLELEIAKYNNLLKAYNIQVDDKLKMKEYLNVSEHFTNNITEGIDEEDEEDEVENFVEGMPLTEEDENIIFSELAQKDRSYYEAIVNENALLDMEINRLKELYSTDDQKVNYQMQQMSILYTLNNFLFWVYYIFVITFAYFLYYNKDILFIIKIAFMAIIILYPFIVYYLEHKIYNILKYVYASLQGLVYKDY